MRRLLLPAVLVFVLLTLTAFSARPTVAAPVLVTPLPPVAHPDGRAGACYSFYDPPERPYLPLILDAGSRWDRFDFVWPNIEPSNDAWDFSAYDGLVNDLRAEGVNIVGVLLWTPDWASGAGVQWLGAPHFNERPQGWYAPVAEATSSVVVAQAASSPPAGLYLPWNHPDNYWGNFVYTVVSHFGDRVKHWEMWNEPDSLYFWSGTSADYAQLLKVGYQATKAACPDCTVLFGGLHYWSNTNFYRWVLNLLNDDPAAPENNYFFDVMSLHLYSRSSDAYDIVNIIRDGMQDFVPEHPIWITETGVPVWDDASVDPDPSPYPWSATQEEAAAYVIQSYANAWASGVERYFYFRTHDADMIEYFGLIRNDRSLRPAYVAYQVATTYLVSPTMVTNWTYSSGVRRVTLWGTPWGKISVLWNTTPTTLDFDYPATLPTATLVDQRGVTQTLVAQGGVYSLTLPGATANRGTSSSDYTIGGEPYLVIEADTTPPTATVQPLPAASSLTVTLSWEGTDEAAGIWGYDVQVREGADGEWANWLRLTSAESAEYEGGQAGETYCFRVRAWDRAGNVSEWSAQTCTVLGREVRFDLESVFGDGNWSGIQDGDEVTLTAQLRLVNGAGVDVVTPTVGSSWRFTATLPPGEYVLVVEPEGWPSPPPGWLPHRRSVVVEAATGPQEIGPLRVGLLPHNGSSFLPLILRQG